MTRNSSFSGSFYPENRQELHGLLREYLSQASHTSLPGTLRALITPHAGYAYSGSIAASAYQLLMGTPEQFEHILLMGPSHRVPFQGMAYSEANYWNTPLGDVALDRKLMSIIHELPWVRASDSAHNQEHSLEVQLPFLQQVLPGVPITPLLVGQCEDDIITETMALCQARVPHTLVIVSSDLSHYLDYDLCRREDARTARSIQELDPELENHQACGAGPIRGLLHYAAQQKWQCITLDLRNSGDTSGDKNRVVGYGAFAFYQPQAQNASS